MRARAEALSGARTEDAVAGRRTAGLITGELVEEGIEANRRR